MPLRRQYRLRICLLIVSWLLFCWYAMQLLHEVGHVMAAWGLGIEIVQFHFGLLTISHTMLNESGQSPNIILAATWAGPLAGMILPLVIWGMATAVRFRETFLLRFLAGFCLVANGCYLLCGPADGYADTGVLLAHGAMRWQLVVAGLIGIISGFLLWNGQGGHFGIGKKPQPISQRSIIISLVCLAAIVVISFCVFCCKLY